MKMHATALVGLLFTTGCSSGQSPERLDANVACYSQRGIKLDCPAHPDAIGYSPYFMACGADGKTYGYWEEAECACVAYRPGSCDPEACSLGDSGPAVCGTDSKTYVGDLTAACHGALRLSAGPCPDGGQP